MKISRSNFATAAVAAAAALAATGITYASAASAPAPEAAPAAVTAAAPAAPAAPAAGAPLGGTGKGGNNNNDNYGNDHDRDRDRDRGDDYYHDGGRIQINERSYFAHPGDCITVVSGLGARSLNIRNDSHRTVEVFRGAVCDNGAPVATVGPHSSSDGVHVRRTKGLFVKNGVVGSFRVVENYFHGGGYGGGYGGGGK
ncbi:hypothetical protein [Streptomyces sp. NK08204]|uniref:hypothetical protein n=1 Tax=Streptomyces sp. NK08204 TaxID=2873260 RepID=UPI001CED0021|nr:hypothetical protein [Streptomyces sp. NK08204]